jgi:chaperone BCS1
MEDIDTAGLSRDSMCEESAKGSKRVTLSGLLNVLDGVSSAQEYIWIATTNNLDKLDEALIRPGRIDVREYIGKATKETAKDMFERIYANTEPNLSDLANQFVTDMIDGEFTPAELQVFLLEKNDPGRACEEFSD